MKAYFKYSIFTVLLITMIAAFNALGIFSIVSDTAQRILNPAQKFFYAEGRKSRDLTSTLMTSKKQLVAEIERLNKMIVQMVLQKAEHEVLLNENRELKKLLDFKMSNSYILKTGRVITRNAGLAGKFIIIDVGKNEGSKQGYAVVSEEGIMIGKVARADARNSVVRLLVDQTSATSASLGILKETQGIVKGARGLALEMDYIPYDVVLEKGMLVKTSGLDDFVPAGLVIGMVANVEEGSSALFQKAVIDSIVDFDAVHTVGIIVFDVTENFPK